MEGAADLERADALVVLTFEEELDPRMRWSLALEGGTDKRFLCLGGGCKIREGRGCQYRCEFDMLFYTFMGRLDGGAVQG